MNSQDFVENERKWSRGSYIAAGFTLVILLYNLITSFLSFSWPTDGWFLRGEASTIRFSEKFLPDPSPIQEGDLLVSVNGQTIEEIGQASHRFFELDSPDWPDGTLLQYEVIRKGETLLLDVPIRRSSIFEFYGALFTLGRTSETVMFMTGILFAIIGVLVFLLRPSNKAAHALLAIGVGFLPIGFNSSLPSIFYPRTPPSIPFDNWTLLVNPSLIYLVLAFPVPKAPLRRYPLLAAGLIYLTWPILFNTAYLLNLDDAARYREIAFMIYPIQIILMLLVVIASFTHSAQTVRDPVGRSQLKWMMAGVGSFAFIGIGGWLVSAYIFPDTMQQGNWLITTIGWFLMPLCLAIAITRYRLFDIDLIIRRTLVYSLLSLLLGTVYLGAITILQSLFTSASGQSSPLAIVLSTLFIAALFTPLRQRTQGFIDRRFYRSKYNSEVAISRFADVARRETNLEELSRQLVVMVQETVQPQQVSLWLVGKEGR